MRDSDLEDQEGFNKIKRLMTINLSRNVLASKRKKTLVLVLEREMEVLRAINFNKGITITMLDKVKTVASVDIEEEEGEAQEGEEVEEVLGILIGETIISDHLIQGIQVIGGLRVIMPARAIIVPLITTQVNHKVRRKSKLSKLGKSKRFQIDSCAGQQY